LLGLLIEIIIFTLVVIRQIESNLKDVISYEETLKMQDKEILNLKMKLNSSQNRDQLETNMNPEHFKELLNQKLKVTITSREAEVLMALMEEGTLKEIANKLFISLNTLKTHASRIYSKLDSRNRLEAIYKALDIIKESKTN
jgi:ATP/maltotriose-dependent transcriptional regulator MalT